jgi:hypothetical protein
LPAYLFANKGYLAIVVVDGTDPVPSHAANMPWPCRLQQHSDKPDTQECGKDSNERATSTPTGPSFGDRFQVASKDRYCHCTGIESLADEPEGLQVKINTDSQRRVKGRQRSKRK